MIPKLYTTKETTAILGIGKTTLWREVKNNRITPTYVGKMRPRFTPESIHLYLIRCNS